MPVTTAQHILGRTGIRVSPLGLAALSMATVTNFRRGTFTARDVERAYHELGINTFLVHYLMPEIMEGVRRLIRAGERDHLVLASEVSMPLGGSVRRGLQRHLRLLGTDHLDIWLFGWVRAAWHLRPSVWDTMRRLQAAGLTRAIGFSSHDRPLAAQLNEALEPDILMLRYNAAHRGAEREVFNTLPEDPVARPGVIAYTATRWGMLLQPLPERGFPKAMAPAECYRFVLAHPAVDMAWCAPGTFDELREDVAGIADGAFAQSRLAEIEGFGDAVHAAARHGRRWMFGQRPD